jgi:hypothetical protein
MAFGSSNLSVEYDGRITEGTPSQDRPSIGSRNTDDKLSKTDIVFEGNLGNMGSDRIVERNGADEMRDKIVMEAAKEQAIEGTGCTIS